MQVKILNKKYDIQPCSELTVQQYIDFLEMLESDANNYNILLCILAVQTGIKKETMFEVDIDDRSINRIASFVGMPKVVSEIEQTDSFYYKKAGRTIYKNEFSATTFGMRTLMENFKGETQIEQIAYIVAVFASKSKDAKKINEAYNELLHYRYEDVIGFGIFFLRMLSNGLPSVTIFSRLRNWVRSISTRQPSNKLQVIG